MTDQRSFEPAPLPPDVASMLVDVLAAAHAREPFLPTDARGAAHRTVEAVRAAGVEAQVLRGSLDLGGAELDHLFAIVQDRVVDVSLPVNDRGFLTVVRAWVAGDVGSGALVDTARDLDLASRVLGLYPAGLRYRGAPLWGAAA